MELGSLTAVKDLLLESGVVRHLMVSIVGNKVYVYQRGCLIGSYEYKGLTELVDQDQIALDYEVNNDFNNLISFLNDPMQTGSLTVFLEPRFQLSEITWSTCKMLATKIANGFVLVEQDEYVWKNIINGRIATWLETQVPNLVVLR